MRRSGDRPLGQREACSVSEPIDLGTGQAYFREPGLSWPCPGPPLGFDLHYRSATNYPGPLSPGWDHTLNWRLSRVWEEHGLAFLGTNGSAGGLLPDKTPASVRVAWQYAYGAPVEPGYELIEGRFRRRPVAGRGLLSAGTESAGLLNVLSGTLGWESIYTQEETQSTNWFTVWDGRRTYTLEGTQGVWRSAVNAWELTALGTNGFVLTQPGGVRRMFDDRGLLTEVADAWGNTISLTRDPSGNLTEARHSNGRTLAFTNDATGRLTGVGGGNQAMDFVYETNGLLRSIVWRGDGLSRTNSYAYQDGLLTTRSNSAGAVFQYVYRPGQDAWGAPEARAVRAAVLPDWYAVRVSYSGETLGRTAFFARGLTWWEDYYFDERGRLTLRAGPWAVATDAESRGTDYGYDSRGNLVSVREFEAGQSAWRVTAEYNDRHQITNVSVGYGTAELESVFRAGWDETWQQPAWQTDETGVRWDADYTNGRARRVEFSGGSLSVEASAAYTGQGQVERVVNANGHAVEAEYDTNGLVRLVAPETGPCVWAGYDAEGRLIEVGRVPERSAFDPDNPPAPLLSAQRDGLGRVIRVTYADNGYESLEHDPLGRVTRVVDRAGRETRVEWLPIGIVTRVTRDATGLAAQVQWLYDQQAQGLTVKDELGRVVESYSLDLQGRAVGVTNAAGQVMSVDYGVADWITSLTRFDGSTVNANYDQLGRLSQVVYPDDTLTLTYGTRRLLTRVADSAGAIEAEYDGLNRVTALTGLGPAGRVSYGRLPAGQVSGMTSVVGVVVYSYDAAERLTRLEQASQGFTYTYNGTNGLLAAVTPDTGGAREMRSYDELDRLSVLTWSEPSSNTLVGLSYQYNLVGLITNLMDATGAAKAYAYDSLDRLISERWREPGGQVVYEAAYGYDLAGNRTQSVVNGRTAAYAYGVGNRLASWSTNSFQAFDGAGNVTNLQYYDGRTLALGWDSRYRLQEVRTNGVLAECYGYDSLDRRAWVSDGVETNYLVYDGDEVIADVGPDGTIMRSYLYGPGIDNILSMTVHGPTTSVYYYVKDHLGSVQAIVDASGAVVESYQYDAWGSVLNVLDSSGNPIQNRQSQIQNRFLWQGREYSWRTGLYYFRARWYEPVTGRWLSNDSIGIAGGLNQYATMVDNPVNFVDPFGLVIEVRDPAQRAVVLATLSKFVRGTLSFNAKGHLQRAKSADDCGVESDVDSLIADDRLYEIIAERRGYGGVFEPWTQVMGDMFWQNNIGQGGRIYFDPHPEPSDFYDINFWGKDATHTAGTILAHELLGRAVADFNREPVGKLGSSVRDKANNRAVKRANPAFDRMGVPRRYRY